MAGSEFESTEDFLATIRRLTNACSREELESVFQEWERRLEECIRIDRDCVSWEELSKLIIIVTAAFYVLLLHFNRTPYTRNCQENWAEVHENNSFNPNHSNRIWELSSREIVNEIEIR
jgi:hypothetical protein